LAAGQVVDIIGGSPVWVPDVASSGIAKDLSGYVSRDRAFKLDDYARGVIDAGSWKGRLYFLTLFANFNVLFYNKALFDRAGVKYPDESWTRETVLDAAKRLTQRMGDPATDVFGFNFQRDLNNVLPWIWQNGGDAFDRPEDPTRATLSSAPTVDALQWLADTVIRHKVAPGEGGAPVPNFTTGRVAMVTQGTANIGRAAADIKGQFPWDIAIHPRGKSGRPNYAGTLFGGIAAITRLPDAAWTFLKYFCGAPGQRVFVEAQVGAPALKELEKVYAALPPPPDNRKAVTDTLPHLRALPKSVKMNEMYSPIFGRLLGEAFSGRTSVAEAARQIDEQATALLRA
jgi:multiple sugar transport system substrate-binding protein